MDIPHKLKLLRFTLDLHVDVKCNLPIYFKLKVQRKLSELNSRVQRGNDPPPKVNLVLFFNLFQLYLGVTSWGAMVFSLNLG